MDLKFTLISCQDLRPDQVNAMWDLFNAHYDYVCIKRFTSDLSKKQFVGILESERNEIKGFTTFGINPAGCEKRAYNILFSGDTILDPACWGSQEMIRGGLEAAGRIVATDPDKPWYWFLISKGHRTYMYLPLFFEQYYPSVDPNRKTAVMEGIVDQASHEMFGEAWKPERGILHFDERLGQLKKHLADGSLARSKNKHVAFFLKRNPGFAQGDELACLTELNLNNIRPRLRGAFEKGLQNALIHACP